MMHRPLPLRVYTVMSALAGPMLYPRVAKKLHQQGTPPERIEERKGYPTEPRPKGRLLWCHAASVGESLSVLHLIEKLGQMHADMYFLMTSGTASSAQIIAKRLPPRTQHQFAPMDTPRIVDRFLQHWRPDAAIFVESEIWPNMIKGAHAAGVPLALVNARISSKSARQWARIEDSAKHVLQQFEMIHCQDAETAAYLNGLGLHHAAQGPNLKAMAAPSPIDAVEQKRMAHDLSARPTWLASSTHEGEEEIMFAAHTGVQQQDENALLVLVPRHPERADGIIERAKNAGFNAALRSQTCRISADLDVYIADTLGELGLWYALVPITCLCGSFVPVGGHNPFEPAQAGSAILHGPQFANFAHVYEAFDSSGAAQVVVDAQELGDAVLFLTRDADARAQMRNRATEQLEAQNAGLEQITRDLSKVLKLS